MVWTYESAVNYIEGIPQYAEKSGVERTKQLLKELGNPEQKIQIIHVAGTNGKGSVCSYMNSILVAGGFCTGLFTSPHLVDIRERILINNKMIDQESFLKKFELVYDAQRRLVEKGEPELAYFDILMGIAILEFCDKKVDYMVMETGLGGRLDSTNAVNNPVVTVITSISLDHTQILGSTLEKIAAEKAGIIKERIPVIFLDNHAEVSRIISESAAKKGAPCVAVNEDDWEIIKNSRKHIDFLVHNRYYMSNAFLINSGAPYQVMNCVMAITAIKVMQGACNLDIDEKSISEGVSAARWNGRMEEILEDVYIDGAHNPDGMLRFLEAAQAVKNNKECLLLFSVVSDKNYDEMIQRIVLSKIFDRFIVTGINGARRLSEVNIRDTFRKFTDFPVDVFESSRDAFIFAMQEKGDGILMCAGSLYLIGEIDSILKEIQSTID